MFGKHVHDGVALMQAQQPVINEHARQLRSDRAVQEAATTAAESTPPDRPSSTRPAHLRVHRSIRSSMMLPGVQALAQPQISCRKRA
jgi:hypothetical protein